MPEAAEDELRHAVASLHAELDALRRLEPLFIEGTAVLRHELASLRTQLGEQPTDAAGLKAELRTTLREATEHLRTLLVEEVNELRGELQGIRARLNDRRTQDRADLRSTLAEGSDVLRAAHAEESAQLRADLEAVRTQLKEQQVADQQLLRAELRAALREWNEHLRTRIVEEATELRSELHQVRGQLTDQQTQHRGDLKATIGEGSGQITAAVAEATAAIRSEVQGLRDQLATRESVTDAVVVQEQLRTALTTELERVRGGVQNLVAQLEVQRQAAQVDIRAAVDEASRVAGASVGQQSDRLLGTVQSLLEQHGARHGEDGQQLRAMVTAGTEGLRAALLGETASTRSSLIELLERLRLETQSVWGHLNDQHGQERAELVTALGEGTAQLERALAERVDAVGARLVATQSAARKEDADVLASLQAATQDELASLRGQVEALNALLRSANGATQEDLGDLRALVTALGPTMTAALAEQRDRAGTQLTEQADRLRAATHDDLRTELGELSDRLRLAIAGEAETTRSAMAAAVTEGAGATRTDLRAALAEEATKSGDALAERSEQLRTELQAVWAQLNDQHTQERVELQAALSESGEQLRATLLVEQTDLIQDHLGDLRSAIEDQVGRLRAAVEDPERAAARLRLEDSVAAMTGDVALLKESVTGEVAAWRTEAADERAAEVESLLAAVAGNEERLHQMVTSLLAEASRRSNEDREQTTAAFAAVDAASAAAAEERQAQLAYLEAALQTFNQALALNRQETQTLVKWSHEATGESVGQLAAVLRGRLDALGSMAARVLAGEGVMEITEAVGALRDDMARLSRKLPAKRVTATTAPAKRVAKKRP